VDLYLGLQTVLFNPSHIFLLLLGTIVGVMFGSIPGLSCLTAMSLLIPITYNLSVIQGVLLLVGTYCGGVYGGSMTSILFRIPGAPENAASSFDGYPMTLKGEASKAIGIAVFSSCVGGLSSTLALITIAPQLMKVALMFGPQEYFSLIFLSLSMIAILQAKSPLKGLATMLFGILIACVGMAPESGAERLTFGFSQLLGGINYIPIIIGMFAISEVMNRIRKIVTVGEGPKKISYGLPSFREIARIKWTLVRGSTIGVFLGALPGIGATISSFMAYDIERGVKKSVQFGTGIIEGVAAPESANNGTTASSMIPLLCLGIPGSVAASILLSAFQLHGIDIGPLFFHNEPKIMNSIFISFIFANLFIILVAALEIKNMVKILKIRFELVGPIIITLCMIGSYSIRNSYFDICVMFIAGLIGYFMHRHGYPIAVLVLAMILGPMLEKAYLRTMLISQGNILSIFQRPMSGGITVIAFLMWSYPILKIILNRFSARGKQ